MELELRPYQLQAAAQVLGHLETALVMATKGMTSQFALSAMTGSGKTVIATAAIEALLHGSSDFDVDADPSVAVLWITDDPALNRQTRNNMLRASNRLQPARLVEVDDDGLLDAALKPGHVYFLNTQKLSRSSRLVQGGTNLRQVSFWEVLANTIASPTTKLVMILDEAHRGMRRPADRATIVLRLINGEPGSNPPMPIVWGISATIERFTNAMAGVTERNALTNVVVDVEQIRASGLVKDAIGLDQPAERGTFSTTLLRDAVHTIRDFDARWTAYSTTEHAPEVVPALVVQVPDKADADKIGELVGVVDSSWPGLGPDAVAHVFGEHEPIVLGSRTIRWVPPESIQGDTDIRVVLAKEAISTGWDCPRAEVLYSERPASDATHIAQVIGRMVRQPLAQRITTDDVLNTVSCYLPLFDRATVESIKAELEGRGADGGEGAVGADVLRAPRVFDRNPLLDPAVFAVLESLPSLPAPDPTASPLRRAKQLARLLADDKQGSALLPGADATLTKRLNAKLDGLAAELADDVTAGVADLRTTDVRRSSVTTTGADVGTSVRHLATHAKDLDRDTWKVVRSVREGVGKAYLVHRVDRANDGADLLAVRVEVAALLRLDAVRPALDAAATAFVQEQLARFAVDIQNTTGATRDAYRRIQEQTISPEPVTVELRSNERAATQTKDGFQIVTFPGHVFADDAGRFPAALNDWESTVIELEVARPTFVGWYRNPSRPTPNALRIGYRDGERWKSLQPDFVIVSRRDDGELRPSIVDPHGDHLADARAKLLALADYAERFGDRYVRIESIAEGTDKVLRAIELKDEATRAAVRAFEDGKVSALYDDGPLARAVVAG